MNNKISGYRVITSLILLVVFLTFAESSSPPRSTIKSNSHRPAPNPHEHNAYEEALGAQPDPDYPASLLNMHKLASGVFWIGAPVAFIYGIHRLKSFHYSRR
ncbi:hypothetical protein B0O80DRAFT_458146 [Mortierella sp. GBAus27b]|nr:hypothetical protein B0O80DRAFT_458146 [Mortierella sp. GBAus27b]